MKNKPQPFSDEEKECTDGVFDGLAIKGKTVTARSFYGCLFRNCDLTGVTFKNCRFRDCRFESCNLSLAAVRGSSFFSTSFKDSKLAGVDWTAAAWPLIKLPGALEFAGCLLNDCSFFGLCLKGARLTNCMARESDFREADLSGADLTHTDFVGSLFGKTDLRGANLDQARNYAISVSDNKVKDARFSMPEAMALLYCLDIKIV
jgi:uncharacterized protein YjbI with pentapeptide repeats